MKEPFSHHRWAAKGLTPSAILCGVTNQADPYDTLTQLGLDHHTRHDNHGVAGSSWYVIDLLSRQVNVDSPEPIDDDTRGQDPGSPHAAIAVVIDLNEE
jgi:hypothetical protein